MNSKTRLSICIATYNRGGFISETLDSILAQMVPGVELVVVDGASPDNTSEVMSHYSSLHPEVRYYREDVNSGVDGDYDKAVGYATGDYCWLMTDDDLLKPGAIKRVLKACKENHSLILVDAEVHSCDLSNRLLSKRFTLDEDKIYKPEDHRKLFVDTVNQLSFIGSVVVKRSIWLERDRQSYYGSFFIHVGVIFQAALPGDALVIAEPQIIIRYGNASWTSRAFEIWMFRWPQMIWSFKSVLVIDKEKITSPEPWRNLKELILLRAKGAYTMVEYEHFLRSKLRGRVEMFLFQLIALFPGKVINMLAFIYTSVFVKEKAFVMTDLRNSKFFFLGSSKARNIFSKKI